MIDNRLWRVWCFVALTCTSALCAACRMMFAGWRFLFALPVWVLGSWLFHAHADTYAALTWGFFVAGAASWLWWRFVPVDRVSRWVLFLSNPADRRRVLIDFDQRWPVMCREAGLTVPARGEDDGVVGPRLEWLGFDERGQLVVVPHLLVGQTVDDYEGAAEQLRVAMNAVRLRVLSDEHRRTVTLVFGFADTLAEPLHWDLAALGVQGVEEGDASGIPGLQQAVAATAFDAELVDVTPGGVAAVDLAAPDDLVGANANEGATTDPSAAVVDTDVVCMGVTEDGAPWMLPTRISTLTAGSTGAGKGSVMWSLLLGQASNIHAGLVQVHGIDLKGGMELSLGAGLFTRLAVDAPEAVVLLEEAAAACQKRARRMAGTARSHVATQAEPIVWVVVDELAALVSYLPDRDLMRRAETALAIVLTQGRAVGYYAFGFLQDPRKETLKCRQLFTQSIALRLRDASETTMMLSDQASRAGARCDLIPRTQPGVAYVFNEAGQVTKVRARYASDDTICQAAAKFATPTVIPIVVPEPEPATRTRRTSRGEAA